MSNWVSEEEISLKIQAILENNQQLSEDNERLVYELEDLENENFQLFQDMETLE